MTDITFRFLKIVVARKQRKVKIQKNKSDWGSWSEKQRGIVNLWMREERKDQLNEQSKRVKEDMEGRNEEETSGRM